MPTVSEAFETYHDFASADLEKIYGKRLLSAKKLTLNTVATGILLNDGKGTFTFARLPTAAQLAPTFGIIATHLDGDGKPDLILAQNFYYPQRETGRMNGSLSIALLGNGDGTFRPLEPNISGISLPGDARSATVVDITGNNRPDLLIARNNASPRLFLNSAAGKFYKIRLQSNSPANPNAIGARVTFYSENGRTEVQDIQSASGYLSQSPAILFSSSKLKKVKVLWPDGSTSEHQPPTDKTDPAVWAINKK